jgi:DNA helicase-2/ATP-dependent DNA helicase PcrA
MYRTNAQSRALEDAFIRAGLPYHLVGATRFYARREIKDVIAFLRVIHNPSDGISMARIINVPPRGIGRKTMDTLESAALERDVPLYEALDSVVDPDDPNFGLRTRAQRALGAFAQMLHGWIAAREVLSVAELIDRVLQDTGYAGYVRDGTEEGEDRWANVLELRNVAAEYAELSLTEFLADVALVSDVDALSDDVDAPSLMTLHSAKGLEFPVVFITGVEEGVLPHSRSLEDPDQLAEERRLMYVGMTRAKDRLYLTHTFIRPRYGETEPGIPSRFVGDIPSDLIAGDHLSSTRPAVTRVTSWETSTQRRSGRPAPAAPASEGPAYRAGQRVQHEAFGEGLIIGTAVQGGDHIVTVMFEDAGLKRLLAGMAPMEILPED